MLATWLKHLRPVARDLGGCRHWLRLGSDKLPIRLDSHKSCASTFDYCKLPGLGSWIWRGNTDVLDGLKQRKAVVSNFLHV